MKYLKNFTTKDCKIFLTLTILAVMCLFTLHNRVFGIKRAEKFINLGRMKQITQSINSGGVNTLYAPNSFGSGISGIPRTTDVTDFGLKVSRRSGGVWGNVGGRIGGRINGIANIVGNRIGSGSGSVSNVFTSLKKQIKATNELMENLGKQIIDDVQEDVRMNALATVKKDYKLGDTIDDVKTMDAFPPTVIERSFFDGTNIDEGKNILAIQNNTPFIFNENMKIIVFRSGKRLYYTDVNGRVKGYDEMDNDVGTNSTIFMFSGTEGTYLKNSLNAPNESSHLLIKRLTEESHDCMNVRVVLSNRFKNYPTSQKRAGYVFIFAYDSIMNNYRSDTTWISPQKYPEKRVVAYDVTPCIINNGIYIDRIGKESEINHVKKCILSSDSIIETSSHTLNSSGDIGQDGPGLGLNTSADLEGGVSVMDEEVVESEEVDSMFGWNSKLSSTDYSVLNPENTYGLMKLEDVARKTDEFSTNFMVDMKSDDGENMYYNGKMGGLCRTITEKPIVMNVDTTKRVISSKLQEEVIRLKRLQREIDREEAESEEVQEGEHDDDDNIYNYDYVEVEDEDGVVRKNYFQDTKESHKNMVITNSIGGFVQKPLRVTITSINRIKKGSNDRHFSFYNFNVKKDVTFDLVDYCKSTVWYISPAGSSNIEFTSINDIINVPIDIYRAHTDTVLIDKKVYDRSLLYLKKQEGADALMESDTPCDMSNGEYIIVKSFRKERGLEIYFNGTHYLAESEEYLLKKIPEKSATIVAQKEEADTSALGDLWNITTALSPEQRTEYCNELEKNAGPENDNNDSYRIGIEACVVPWEINSPDRIADSWLTLNPNELDSNESFDWTQYNNNHMCWYLENPFGGKAATPSKTRDGPHNIYFYVSSGKLGFSGKKYYLTLSSGKLIVVEEKVGETLDKKSESFLWIIELHIGKTPFNGRFTIRSPLGYSAKSYLSTRGISELPREKGGPPINTVNSGRLEGTEFWNVLFESQFEDDTIVEKAYQIGIVKMHSQAGKKDDTLACMSAGLKSSEHVKKDDIIESAPMVVVEIDAGNNPEWTVQLKKDSLLYKDSEINTLDFLTSMTNGHRLYFRNEHGTYLTHDFGNAEKDERARALPTPRTFLPGAAAWQGVVYVENMDNLSSFGDPISWIVSRNHGNSKGIPETHFYEKKKHMVEHGVYILPFRCAVARMGIDTRQSYAKTVSAYHRCDAKTFSRSNVQSSLKITTKKFNDNENSLTLYGENGKDESFTLYWVPHNNANKYTTTRISAINIWVVLLSRGYTEEEVVSTLKPGAKKKGGSFGILKDVLKFIPFVSPIGAVAGLIGEIPLSDAVDGLIDAVSTVGDAAEDIGSAIGDGVGSAIDAAEDIGSAIGDGVGSAIDGAEDLGSAIGDGLSETVSEVGKFFSSF